jgi:hypothetical protein
MFGPHILFAFSGFSPISWQKCTMSGTFGGSFAWWFGVPSCRIWQLSCMNLIENLSEPFSMLESALSLNVSLGVGVIVAVVLADGLCRPRPAGGVPVRSLAGSLVLVFATLAALGAALFVTGEMITSAALVAALGALVALVSNIKNRVLGEPLVFTDFALIGAVFQHPQFYVSALRGWQIAVLIGGFAALLLLLLWLSSAAIAPRFVGLGLGCAAGLLLVMRLRSRRWDELAANPDSHHDGKAHGLIPTLLVHWSRWRKLSDPAPCKEPPIAAQPDQLVIIIQCESFTDPVDMWGDPELALPGLTQARAMAQQSGRLMAHGFGAYTMRTEYGVLFGRGERELGLRKFDPFLTADGETSFSIARRLDADTWACHFVHPHDLRFYGRDRLMVKAGFSSLVGEDAFAPPLPGEGRYVSDAAVAEKIADLASSAASPTLIYAVTIENHGPWPAGKGAASGASGEQYLRLLKRSDAMLVRLMELARELQRPVLLCFFGDHRPSIPGRSEPGGDRHTPYVLLNIGPDGAPRGCETAVENDLTPAQLHHLILDAIRSGCGQG